MKIAVLMENTCLNDKFLCEHGLSVYVETENHKILVDTGSSDQAWKNAEKLNINIGDVDLLFLSHGHYDHSGGILSFRQLNKTAPIYMQKTALKEYWHGERYIGIDKDISKMEGIHLIEGSLKIDEEVEVFSEIKGRRFWPSGNRALSLKVGDEFVQDEFDHEQCIVIRGHKNVLISGCAHNGILNIMDRYKEIYGDAPDLVISGFHMMKKTDYDEEEIKNIEDTARELAKEKTIFYSGHCTGQKALELMEPILKDKLINLHSGMVFE